MKHLILTLSLLTGLFFSASAQQQQDSKYKVSLGGELLYAIGNTAEFYNLGYGASVQGEYKLSPKLNITASGGYMKVAVSKLYKEMFEPWGQNFNDLVIYPVKAGLKYNFHKNFYAAAEAGAAISPDQDARATSFAYAGALGATLPISLKSSFDIGFRYESWALSTSNNYSFAGVRAAYVFGF